MMRFVGLALCVMAMTAALAQAPEPDLKDPAAVGRAYLEACERWELEAGARLLTKPTQAGRAKATFPYYYENIIKEMLCLPWLQRVRYVPAEPAIIGDECRIPVVVTYSMPQTLVLRKQPDGTWKVDLRETVLATTGEVDATLVRTEQEDCLSNLKQMGLAILQYAQDHDEVLPHADKWCEEIFPYMKNDQLFICPERPDLECGYAFNAALSGLPLGAIAEPAQTIILFDSDQGRKNGSAYQTAMPKPGRHNGGNNVSYVDGHVKWLADQ